MSFKQLCTIKQIQINDLKLKLRDLQSEHDNYAKDMSYDLDEAYKRIDYLNSVIDEMEGAL